jgi:hypothetical protein
MQSNPSKFLTFMPFSPLSQIGWMLEKSPASFIENLVSSMRPGFGSPFPGCFREYGEICQPVCQKGILQDTSAAARLKIWRTRRKRHLTARQAQ